MARCTCPVFRPSLAEFRDFQGYLARIEEEAMESGICKIVPPEGWWLTPAEVAALCSVDGEFGDCEISGPVEQRILGRLGVFEVTHEVKPRMSVRRLYERSARARCPDAADEWSRRRSLRGSSGSELEQRERRFWQSLATNESGAYYGADDPHLSVFRRLRETTDAGDWEEGASEWHLDRMPNDPLRRSIPGSKLGGVTEPMVYVGAWRALFAWHVEDANLYSINLIHFGAPKSWYGISPKDARKFEQFAALLFPEKRDECPHFLRHKMSIVSPKLLRDNGFRVSECVHNAGEIMITLPEAYHSGFNHGFNVAESTNFATSSWPSAGRRATVCKCHPEAVQLPIEDIARAIENPRQLSSCSEEGVGKHRDDDDDQPAVDDASDDDDDDDQRSAVDETIVDVRDGWGRVHVKGSRRDSDTWVPLSTLDKAASTKSSRADPVTPKSQNRRRPSTPETVQRRQRRRNVTSQSGRTRRPRCGDCDACVAPECGECKYCLDATKRGGPGKLKQSCIRRRCLAVWTDN